jgi:outer membrane protein OmpA-like peptidoglycan-associated protein
MKKFVLLLFFIFSITIAKTQSSVEELENLVPNPSFEEYSKTPIGWYYRGSHFTDVMRYWSSATAASPDAFSPKVRVPEHWADKGFGEQKVRTGASMVGITVYGCEEGKPHCREYIQVQLLESLVPAQTYYIEFWAVALPRSLQVNNIGAHFTIGPTDIKIDRPIVLTPLFNTDEVVGTSPKKWTKVFGYFTATEESDYILIGNFFPDSLTKTVVPKVEEPLKFAYYYIDDVMVKKIPPIVETPLSDDDISLAILETGKIFQLKNIFFDTDKFELLPRSYQELRKLLRIMQENPNMVIEVRGHTDSQGSESYNQYLSRQRAQEVVNFLNNNGIAPERTLCNGFGSTLPIASNKNEVGRQLNRRVEILIVQK